MPRLEGLQSTQLLNAYPDGMWQLQPFKKPRTVFEKQTLWTSHKLEVQAQEEKNYMKKERAYIFRGWWSTTGKEEGKPVFNMV